MLKFHYLNIMQPLQTQDEGVFCHLLRYALILGPSFAQWVDLAITQASSGDLSSEVSLYFWLPIYS